MDEENYRTWKVVRDIPEYFLSEVSRHVPAGSWYIEMQHGYALGGPLPWIPSLPISRIEALAKEGYFEIVADSQQNPFFEGAD